MVNNVLYVYTYMINNYSSTFNPFRIRCIFLSKTDMWYTDILITPRKLLYTQYKFIIIKKIHYNLKKTRNFKLIHNFMIFVYGREFSNRTTYLDFISCNTVLNITIALFSIPMLEQ